MSKENFENKKTHLEPLWREVVNMKDEYTTVLDGEEDKGDGIEEVKIVLVETISCIRNRNR